MRREPDVNLNKTNRRITIAMTTFTAVILSASTAFASNTLESIMGTIVEYFYPVRSILIGAAGFCALISLGMWMLAPSDRAAENGKRWFIRLLIGIAILFCLGGVFNFLAELGEGNGLDISQVMGN